MEEKKKDDEAALSWGDFSKWIWFYCRVLSFLPSGSMGISNLIAVSIVVGKNLMNFPILSLRYSRCKANYFYRPNVNGSESIVRLFRHD